ncbi:MAG: Smr/MutS family protein [Anaeroplasmataceae bacterium]|nr:Smr/MutS family protein [Anaeroplasmataceae bacterium]MDE6414434.1 Smr/MutS family protein [Anaeroplasmataceae bacterium]
MSVELDLHGFTIPQAIHMIQRTIVANPKCTCIEVIHGYNNGCILKNVLKNKYNIHNRKVIKTVPAPFNEGRTLIFLEN